MALHQDDLPLDFIFVSFFLGSNIPRAGSVIRQARTPRLTLSRFESKLSELDPKLIIEKWLHNCSRIPRQFCSIPREGILRKSVVSFSRRCVELVHKIRESASLIIPDKAIIEDKLADVSSVPPLSIRIRTT